MRMMISSRWLSSRKVCLRPSRRPRNFWHLSRTRRRGGVSRVATPATGGGGHDICADCLEADRIGWDPSRTSDAEGFRNLRRADLPGSQLTYV